MLTPDQGDQSPDNFYFLGPGAFPEVSQSRISQLFPQPVFELKILTHILSALEHGEEIELSEELSGQEGEEVMHDRFVDLLENIDDPHNTLQKASAGFGSLEKFTDREAVSHLHKTLFDLLVAQGWTQEEVLCGDLVACGYFEISELETL